MLPYACICVGPQKLNLWLHLALADCDSIGYEQQLIFTKYSMDVIVP